MMTAVIIRTVAGQEKYLNIILTAVLFPYRCSIIMPMCICTMTASAAMTDCFSTALMLRMNIFAIRTFQNSHDKTLPALHACMHIKAYDTHAVPYDHKHCGYFHRNISHITCKVIKNIQIARFL